MNANLAGVTDALASLTDAELHALIIASNETPKVACGPLVGIEGACDWERNRRVGRDYPLLPPDAAFDPTEDAVSIEATYAMRPSFAASDMAPAALQLFDALVALLTGKG
jgi:hypothetical protein